MFCKHCRYNLYGIESQSCPECGRVFDLGNPKTYRKGVGLPKFMRRLFQGFLLISVVALIALCVIELRYQQEAGVVEALDAEYTEMGGYLYVEWSDDHQWAKGIPFLYERLQHVVCVNIGGNDLTAIPPAIWNLTNLEQLGINDNQLTTLPPEIGNLTKLRWLELSENLLATLPPEIGKLPNLTELYVYVNQLTTLPPEIGMLTSLEKLDLSNNEISTLPPQVGKLTKLERLSLAGNQIMNLPLEIGEMLNLKHLDIDDKVSDVSVSRVQNAIPGCLIFRWLR